MATSSDENMLVNAIQNFSNLTKKPELYLSKEIHNAEAFKTVCKYIHDNLSQLSPVTTIKSKTLSKLLVDGFDDEQIWQQLELKNIHAKSRLSDSGINADQLSQTRLKDCNKEHTTLLDNSKDEAPIQMEENEEESDYSSEEGDNDLSNCNENEEVMSDFNEDKDAECGKEKTNKSSTKTTFKKASAVDDQFFKLSKLEHFLRVEDLKEEKARDGELLEESDEEEIDLFQDIPSDDMDDDEKEDDSKHAKSSRNYKYTDFFDAPGSEDENSLYNEENMDSDNEYMNSATEDMPSESDDNEDKEDNDVTSSQNKKNSSKTQFELQQENVKKQISEYEQSILNPKPWHLTGEVDATKRPKNALLRLETDFESNAKPTVIQDKNLCEKLENMIRMTIKNKAYSDGVRQYKTNDEIIAYKKRTEIDQNKSKKSLAQEYEDMYLKKQGVQQEEEDPKHKEIKNLMDSLFPELYALFSHIPKPAIPEIKIVSNLPAITVEEVAPTSVSDVALLAPEEIKKRTGLIKGKTERTDVDKKRERRKKKLHQKFKYKRLEKEIAEGKAPSSAAKELEKINIIKKLKHDRQTKFIKVDNEKIKSSKDFFERLQDTVSTNSKKFALHEKKKKKE